MKEEIVKETFSVRLTIGDVTYKTSGNILFSESQEVRYYLAESSMLDKVDQAIEKSLLGNALHTILKKASAEE